MRPRLACLFALLLCLLLGMQGAVCELTCGFAASVRCHAAGSTQHAANNAAMVGMHCAGMKNGGAAQSVCLGVQSESGGAGSCCHALPNVIANAGTVNGSDAAIERNVPPETKVVTARLAVFSGRRPMLRTGSDPVLRSLRV